MQTRKKTRNQEERLEHLKLNLMHPVGSSDLIEETQLKVLTKLATFIELSYSLGSNPLSVLRPIFDKFSWECVPIDAQPGKETEVLDEVKDACFLFFDYGEFDGQTSSKGAFLIKVTPSFAYRGLKFVMAPHLNDHLISTFLKKAGFIVQEKS